MNTRKLAATLALGLALTTCSSPAVSDIKHNKTITAKAPAGSWVFSLEKQKQAITQLEKEAAVAKTIEQNKKRIQDAINNLHKYVGKTWYVFSGSTPSGWDCSGLTLWFYEQLNISLEHRASKQADSGKLVENPSIGDLVVFHYLGSLNAYHVGIYIGNGNMIHAPAVGKVTRVENIKTFGGKYSEVTYRSFIKTA